MHATMWVPGGMLNCCFLSAVAGAVLSDNLEVVAEKANEAVKTVSQPQVRCRATLTLNIGGGAACWEHCVDADCMQRAVALTMQQQQQHPAGCMGL